MIPAAIRLLIFAAALFGAATGFSAAASRPAPLTVTRIKNVEYVSMTDAARRLGMKGTWTEARKKYTVADAKGKIVLTAGSREAWVNGLRLHLGNPTELRRTTLYISRTDFERSIAPMVRPAFAGPTPPRPRIIALDPGHGGPDIGAQNAALKINEKTLALDVAVQLRKLLEAAGYQVVMTRTDDRVPTQDFRRRAEVVNAAGAHLLISIHFNALENDTRTGGSEVFVFTPTGQRSTESWSSGKDDIEATDAPVNRHDGWSAVLAHAMHRELLAGLGTSDRGHKTKHSAILRLMNCPAVLVEALFLSNEAEARKASTPEYRQKIAEVLQSGIERYIAALESARPKPAKK